MQRLEVSGVVRLIYRSLGVKGLKYRSSQTVRNNCTKNNCTKNNCTKNSTLSVTIQR